jgi:hypothetical protein
MGASPVQTAPAANDAASPETGASAQIGRIAPVLVLAREAPAEPRAGPDHASRLLGFQATVLSHDSFPEAATAFATELAAALHCDRVAIGFVERRHVTLAAISHGTDFQPRNEAFLAIGAAMEEAVEQSVSVAVPATEGETPRIALAHAEIVRRQGGAVCTIPLAGAGETYGAITLERSGSAAFSSEELAFCEQVACFVGPVLRLKRESEDAWSARLARVLPKSLERIFGAGKWGAKLALLLAAGTVAALLMIPASYRLSAPARLEGSIQRALVAPSDGFLKLAHVRPGDLVRANQVVAEFSDDDLQLERRKWESAAAQHENGYATALARSDRAQFMILRAKAEEARAQIGLIEQQLARTRLTAPFDGVIIKGDLRQSLGAPVQRGEVLLTLAPAGMYRLIVEVDERDVGRVRPGQKGSLVLASMADRAWPFAIERVTPIAVVRDGHNLFEVEAKLDTVNPAMQAGLEGVAKIEVGEEVLAWIFAHRLLDWLRLTLWTWGF